MRSIHMGVPEMEALWNDLTSKADQKQLKGEDKKLFKKLTKTLGYLQQNPRHPGLASHDIDELTKRSYSLFPADVWSAHDPGYARFRRMEEVLGFRALIPVPILRGCLFTG